MSFCSYVSDNDLELNYAVAGVIIGVALMGIHFYYTTAVEFFNKDKNQKELVDLALSGRLNIHVPMAFFIGTLGAFAGSASGAALEIVGDIFCPDDS